MIDIRILYIALQVDDGTGGKVIQDRNKQLLKEYCGDRFKANNYPYKYFSFHSMHSNVFDNGNPTFLKRIYGGLGIAKNKIKAYEGFEKQIKEFNPDYIFCDNSIFAVADKKIFKKYKFITFFHNVEKLYYEQQCPNYKTDKRLEKNHSNIIENEQFICDNAQKIICINERDSKELKEIYSRSADLILPTSMKDSFDNKYALNDKGNYLLFVGCDFFGNTDGLFWFIENCLDDINIPLVVVGRGMDKYSNKYPNKNVKFLGFVDDLGEYYKNASAVILPIISGSGMKTKTCEAFMFGKTVIGTYEAFEGYDSFEKAGAILANTKEEFIENINDFCRKETTAFSQKARDYYLDNYSFEKSKEKMFEFLRGLE